MKRLLIISVLFTLISCSSVDGYLRDKNFISSNDHVKYRVIEENEVEEKREVKAVTTTPKVEEKKVSTNVTKQSSPKVEEKKEVKAVTTTPKVEEKKTSTTASALLNQLANRVENSTVTFSSEDERIIAYISEIVVENEAQIRTKTIDSLNRLKQKGINLTAKEFLALAYKNVKDTRVNSYILAVARVMNNVERGKK